MPGRMTLEGDTQRIHAERYPTYVSERTQPVRAPVRRIRAGTQTQELPESKRVRHPTRSRPLPMRPTPAGEGRGLNLEGERYRGRISRGRKSAVRKRKVEVADRAHLKNAEYQMEAEARKRELAARKRRAAYAHAKAEQEYQDYMAHLKRHEPRPGRRGDRPLPDTFASAKLRTRKKVATPATISHRARRLA